MAVSIIRKIGEKMAPKSTIISKLEIKEVELSNHASTSKMRASALTDEIADLHVSAKAEEAKSEAINQALTILYNAGVEV